VDLPLALAEQLEAARMLEQGITKERLPFVYGWHRLSVSAPTRELCQRRVEALVEHYRDIGIDVVNSTGDQFSLLCESLPGDRVRLSSYVQRQPLYTIPGGVPPATGALGDPPRGGCLRRAWSWATGRGAGWTTTKAGWVPTSARRWAGRGPSSISTRCWRRPATGRRRWRSPASRAAARPPWRC